MLQEQIEILKIVIMWIALGMCVIIIVVTFINLVSRDRPSEYDKRHCAAVSTGSDDFIKCLQDIVKIE